MSTAYCVVYIFCGIYCKEKQEVLLFFVLYLNIDLGAQQRLVCELKYVTIQILSQLWIRAAL